MKNKSLTIAPVALVAITFMIGLVLSSTLTHADGNTDVVDELDVTVNSACTMKGGPNGTDDTGSSTYTTTINAGNYTELPGSKLVTLCNDPAGYAIYAIGFSGDSYDSQTHTDLIGTATTGNIQTGTSGNNSYWAMKLEAVEGLTPPSIVTDFQNYHVIPDAYTKVASYTTPTATASDAGSTVQTKYKINISKTQLAGAYNGKVKYTMVHPNTAPAPTPPAPLPEYCVDASTCMQNTTNPPACGTTMIDGRDGNSYTTATIANTCWMTQNLRFQGTNLKVGESDVSSDITMVYNYFPDYEVGDPINVPYIAINSGSSSATAYGVYYNYCATTAGEICESSSSLLQSTRSVCPAGWTLPTVTQIQAVPQFDSHFTNPSTDLAGNYNTTNYNSYPWGDGYEAFWWSSNRTSIYHNLNYLYYQSEWDVWQTDNDGWESSDEWSYGVSVRCVRAS